ncbi:MAG: hypothetical protein QM638_02910 [Nocardioides sp.]|uniref:hypothetical protein n=1 Tax=Nocardioides sp. TaxID=35761 RepID=UPI0039E32451
MMPVNAPGYAAQKPPSEYSYDEVSSFLTEGLVYVAAGIRSKDSNTDDYTGNAPWGVVDLKAAIRYVRFNPDLVPGAKDKVFVFGHNGGGAQSSVAGASGDSSLYAPYLNALGAAMTSTDGTALSLGTSDSGTYYDHIVSVVEESLNNFIADTTFPYTPSNSFSAGMVMPSSSSGSAGGAAGSSSESSTTYDTLDDYIASLNADTTWVTYDASTKKATITGLAGFVASQKSPSKSVGVFDGPDRSATENVVFGLNTDGLHFSPVSRNVIKANQSSYEKYDDWKDDYAASEYASDFKKTDGTGETVSYRGAMYNPLYFLTSYYKGHKSATVAPHWRIRTGIMQGDTANTTEVNLALESYGVDDLDFATVWGQGHTQAERTGDATTNLISWVKNVAA